MHSQPLLRLMPVEQHELPLREVPAMPEPTWKAMAIGALLWSVLAIPAALLGALAGWVMFYWGHQ